MLFRANLILILAIILFLLPTQVNVGLQQQPSAQLRQQQYQPYLGVPAKRQQPPTQPPAPAKPKEPQTWACPRCTLFNDPMLAFCKLCECKRPDPSAVPKEAPLSKVNNWDHVYSYNIVNHMEGNFRMVLIIFHMKNLTTSPVAEE